MKSDLFKESNDVNEPQHFFSVMTLHLYDTWLWLLKYEICVCMCVY